MVQNKVRKKDFITAEGEKGEAWWHQKHLEQGGMGTSEHGKAGKGRGRMVEGPPLGTTREMAKEETNLGGKHRPGLQRKPQLGVLAAETWHLHHRRAGPVGEVRAG